MTSWLHEVPLQEGELFSTWIARAALAQGCDPLVLTGLLWPKWRAWTVDLDRGVSAARLRAVASASGIPVQSLIDATLLATAQSVASVDLSGLATWPWILVLGGRNRTRRGGLHFCPRCLAEDRLPYYRRHWRFAWHSICAHHQCGLEAFCPNCGAPIQPHRLTIYDKSLTVCAACRGDLSETQAATASTGALDFQNLADKTIREGHGRYGDARLPVAEWFALARYFVGLIRKVALGNRHSLAALVKELEIQKDTLISPATGLALEFLPASERQPYLCAVGALLAAGPDRFVEAARHAGVTPRTLHNDRLIIPISMGPIAEKLPLRARARRSTAGIKVGPMPPHSVMRKWARLRRKALNGRPVEPRYRPRGPEE